MADLPDSVFTPEDTRYSESHWGAIFPSANLDLVSLYLDNVTKVSSRVLRYALEVGDLAISVKRCGTLHGFCNLLPSTPHRAKWITNSYVFPLGEQLLRRLGVSFHELTPREVGLFN